MNWYKKAKLNDTSRGLGSNERRVYNQCMFCKRWGTEDGSYSGNGWNKEEELSDSDKQELFRAIKEQSKGYPKSKIGISHGICDYCYEIMGGAEGYPSDENEIRNLKEKSLNSV